MILSFSAQTSRGTSRLWNEQKLLGWWQGGAIHDDQSDNHHDDYSGNDDYDDNVQRQW